jgi:catechol 2,3-dioxygenase-like lactoylglutathione lyase family enzyme
MIEQKDTPMQTQIAWRGFHHIALATPDLDATIQFYGGILGMHVGEVQERSQRHCFIKPGSSDTWGMQFFETDDTEIFPYPGITERFAFIPGALQHIAFALPDEQAAMDLRKHLAAHGIDMTPINTIGPIRNFLFMDNNGVLLEATWPAL